MYFISSGNSIPNSVSYTHLLYGMSLPREYDGLNFPMVPYVMAAELVSRGDGGFANIWGLQDCAETIHEFANEEQKRQYLPRAAKGDTYATVSYTHLDVYKRQP